MVCSLYTAKKVQHPGVHNRVPVHLLDRYGSLCWRPEESFAGFERFDGEVVGWKRLFAQKVRVVMISGGMGRHVCVAREGMSDDGWVYKGDRWIGHTPVLLGNSMSCGLCMRGLIPITCFSNRLYWFSVFLFICAFFCFQFFSDHSSANRNMRTCAYVIRKS